MKIAVIGTGNVGGALAKAWVSTGHQVLVGVRDNGSEKAVSFRSHTGIDTVPLKEAVEASDVILLAIPPTAVPDLVRSLGVLKGKLIIDATNSVFRKPEPWATAFDALSELTEATIIKCFNSTGAENMRDPNYQVEGVSIKADMFLAGDDPEALMIVSALAEDVGFNAIVFGDSSSVPLLEALCRIWIHLAMNGLGRQFAFKALLRNAI